MIVQQIEQSDEPERGERVLPGKIAIVAALEREIKTGVKNWRALEHDFEGRKWKVFDSERAVLVCSGIGPEAARRATEALISLYHPLSIISTGFAGALDSQLKIGDLFMPRYVVNAKDGSRIDTGTGAGTLVSSPWIAGTEQKLKLGNCYGAQAVDMESASVALGAEARGIPFLVVKAISDELNFPLPPLDRFVSHDGRFRSTSFVRFAVIRPWLWPSILRLIRCSERAAESLCAWLNQYNHPQRQQNQAAEFDPRKVKR